MLTLIYYNLLIIYYKMSIVKLEKETNKKNNNKLKN